MARGSRRSAVPTATANVTRDPLAQLLRPPAMPASNLNPLPDPLSLLQDNRQWHPLDEFRPTLAVDQEGMRIGVGRSAFHVHKRPVIVRSNTLWSARGLPVGLQVPVGTRWESPFKVVTCARRKVRRAVMFARKKVGLGAKAKVRKRNRNSGVSC